MYNPTAHMYTRQKDTCRREGTAVSTSGHHQCTLAVLLFENKHIMHLHQLSKDQNRQQHCCAHLRYRRDFVEACCWLFNLSHT